MQKGRVYPYLADFNITQGLAYPNWAPRAMACVFGDNGGDTLVWLDGMTVICPTQIGNADRQAVRYSSGVVHTAGVDVEIIVAIVTLPMPRPQGFVLSSQVIPIGLVSDNLISQDFTWGDRPESDTMTGTVFLPGVWVPGLKDLVVRPCDWAEVNAL